MVLLVYVLASAAAAAPSIFFKPGVWYGSLKKPAFTPPSWAFSVAWMTIYTCSSLSAARMADAVDNELFLALWALQISLNAIWTPIFFGVHKIRASLVVILILFFVVCLMTLIAIGKDVVSAMLLAPYIFWLVLAASLNFYVVLYNDPAALARNVD
jgi:tryptophan-rich sensory protein